MMNRKLSVIIPSYQSGKNLAFSCSQISKILTAEIIPYEIIIVDDGSSDNSFEIALELSKSDSNIKPFQLSRNYTSPYAMFAGYRLASGACVVAIPDDLQRPLESVIRMYREWEAGAKIVIGYRKSRNDGFINDLLSNAYYWIMNRFSNIKFPPGGADGFLADREIIDIICNKISHRNTSPIIEVLQIGFDPVFIPFDRPKATSKSRWTFKKKTRLAFNTFFSSSVFPIKLVTGIGFTIFSLSILMSAVVIFIKLFSDNTLFGFPIPGWASIILVIMFFNGMTMLCLGIISEYIWRIFEEVKGRPPYIIKNKDNNNEHTLS